MYRDRLTAAPAARQTLLWDDLQGRLCMPCGPLLDCGLPAADNNTLLVITQWRSATALAAVDLTSGRVQRLGDVTKEASSWFFAGQSAGEQSDLHG